MTSTTLKKLLPILVQEWISLLLLKWEEKSIPFLLIKKSKQNSKNLNEQRNSTVRICDKCGETKPLNADHYQEVKFFKQKYSFYCNECNKPKPRD